MNEEPRTQCNACNPFNLSPWFLLLVLFGVIWCSLVLFGPKIYFVNRGSFDMPEVPIIPLNPEPGGLFSGPLYLWRS